MYAKSDRYGLCPAFASLSFLMCQGLWICGPHKTGSQCTPSSIHKLSILGKISSLCSCHNWRLLSQLQSKCSFLWHEIYRGCVQYWWQIKRREKPYFLLMFFSLMQQFWKHTKVQSFLFETAKKQGSTILTACTSNGTWPPGNVLQGYREYDCFHTQASPPVVLAGQFLHVKNRGQQLSSMFHSPLHRTIVCVC